MFEVILKRKILKSIENMPEYIQKKMGNLLEDLRTTGPIQPGWQNFSKLDKNCYHYHLSKKWIACWLCEKDSKVIEVYYAGSRENAPY